MFAFRACVIALLAFVAVVTAAPVDVVIAERAASQITCRPSAEGPWTLERERQQRQGLWLSPMKQDGARLAAATNVGKNGQQLTFYACDSKALNLKASTTSGDETVEYGQLRTARGTCLTLLPGASGADKSHFVAKPCSSADDGSLSSTFFKLTKSKRNGLGYRNTNYRLYPSAGKQDFSLDLALSSGLLWAKKGKGQFTSGMILYAAKDL